MNKVNSMTTEGANKVDNQATNRLLGVEDSLAYRTHELERHFHVSERWYGLAAGAPGSRPANAGDLVGPSIEPFVLTSGNNDWGSWLQLLGTGDTPGLYPDGVKVKFDPHRIQVTTANSTATYFIQFTRGSDADASFLLNRYTEIPYTPNTNRIDAGPVNVKSGRANAGSIVWARCMCLNQDAKTIAFYLGIHEYVG